MQADSLCCNFEEIEKKIITFISAQGWETLLTYYGFPIQTYIGNTPEGHNFNS